MRITRFHIAMMTMICVMSFGAIVEAGFFDALSARLFGPKDPAHLYFPAEKGSRWEYEAVGMQHGLPCPQKDPYTMSFESFHEGRFTHSGQEYFSLTMRNLSGHPLWIWDLYYKDGTVCRFADDSVWMDFNAEPGALWFVDSEYSPAGIRDTGVTAINYLGCDKAIVPAGIFENCHKYRLEYTSYAVERNESVPTLRQRSETYWFAPKVGMVKLETERSIDSGESYIMTYSLCKFSGRK